MGDRFYTMQKEYKPSKYTKAMIVEEVSEVLGTDLSKLSVANKDVLMALLKAVTSKV